MRAIDRGRGGILETEEDVSEDDHFEINSQCNEYNYEHNEETVYIPQRNAFT